MSRRRSLPTNGPVRPAIGHVTWTRNLLSGARVCDPPTPQSPIRCARPIYSRRKLRVSWRPSSRLGSGIKRRSRTYRALPKAEQRYCGLRSYGSMRRARSSGTLPHSSNWSPPRCIRPQAASQRSIPTHRTDTSHIQNVSAEALGVRSIPPKTGDDWDHIEEILEHWNRTSNAGLPAMPDPWPPEF